MYTRCPHCETVFRVTTQQLQISSGQVRCGLCTNVFDAFTTLSSQPLARTETTYTPPKPSMAPTTAPAPAPAVQPKPSKPVVEPEVLTLPDELFGSGAAPAGRRWPWIAGSMVLLIVLAGQAAWFFPTDIATRIPELRPVLVQFCAWSQCTVQLPRLPEQLFIEASDLQVLDPAHPSEVLLTAVIRNRAPTSQDLPMLELTLTDASNQTAARKVFSAADYLDTGADVRRGIAANQEISIRVYLDTGNLKATGYRLYLFFA
jgi:predicted Zn finger-like uncharacterized protein